MSHTTTTQLRLPAQARPVDRSGSETAGVAGGGVEPAFLGSLLNLIPNPFGGTTGASPIPFPPIPFPPLPLPW